MANGSIKVYAVPDIDSLLALPKKDGLLAILDGKDTYRYDEDQKGEILGTEIINGWVKTGLEDSVEDTSKDIEIYKFKTIKDMEALLLLKTLNDDDLCMVAEKDRGGTFVYDSSKKNINDGGKIFYGAVRQNENNFDINHYDLKSGKENINKNIDILKDLVRQNKINEKIIFNPYDAGAKEDDGWSTAAHKATSGVVYYFSSSTGNDSNDGLTPETAWKTFYKFQAKMTSFQPGDAILFKRGDVWSQETEDIVSYSNQLLGSKDNNIIVSCYGVGKLPKFSGKVEQNSLSWTNNGDGTWSTVIAADKHPNTKIKSLDIEEKRGTGAYTLDELKEQSSIRDFYHDETNGIMYVTKDPSRFKIEWADGINCFSFQGSSSFYNLEYLETEWFRGVGLYSYKTSEDVVIANCKTGNGSQFGIKASGKNFKCYNNIISSGAIFRQGYDKGKNTYPSDGFEGIRCWGDSTCTGMEIYNNTIRNFGHASIALNGGVNDSDGFVTGAKVYNNILDGRELLYGGKISVQFKEKDYEIFNNIIIGGDRSQFTGLNGYVHDNIWYNKYNSQFHPYNENGGITTNVQEDGLMNTRFEDNIFFNLYAPGISFSQSNTGPTDSNIIKHNIFYKTCIGPAVYEEDSTDIQVLIKTNYTGAYAYNVTNQIVEENVFITDDLSKKQVAVGSERLTKQDDVSFTTKDADARTFNEVNFINNKTFLDADILR